MNERQDHPPSPWLPALIVLVVALLLALGWFLFPRFAAYMAREDCIATGRVNCDR